MANQAKQRKIEKNSCVGLKERIVELERQLELYKKTHSETQRLAVVVKDSNDAVTVQDLQGNITAWNYGAERIYGYTEAEALQMNIFQIIPKDKKRETLQFFKRIKNGETNESFETQRLTKEGETLDVWLTVTPLRDSKGKLREIATTERDITDRKQIEASLKIRTETIKFFSYSVLHDLKSPTITINGLTQRLLRNLSEISREKIEKYCSQILRTSEQLTRLVEQLNIFITEKETPHTIEHVSVAELMQIIRDEFFPQLNLRGVQINEQDNIPTICGDRISLLRSFRNLVDNALKYGGKKLSEIEIGYKETEQFHIFFVRDNGVGLIGKKPENLFDPFKREKSAAGTYGSGLGLAIVKEIAKQHGGKAWLEENQENGITFYFSVAKSLPVAPLETP